MQSITALVLVDVDYPQGLSRRRLPQRQAGFDHSSRDHTASAVGYKEPAVNPTSMLRVTHRIERLGKDLRQNKDRTVCEPGRRELESTGISYFWLAGLCYGAG